MPTPEYYEQFAQCLGKFAFQAMTEAGFRITINDEALAKNLGGFFSDSAHHTQAPRYLAFSLDFEGNDPDEATFAMVEKRMKKFVRTINRDFNLKDNPLEVDFERDYDGRLRMVYLKIEPLLEEPRLLARIVRLLDRRHFIGGGVTAIIGVNIYLMADKAENKAVRWVGKGVGIGSVIAGGVQMVAGSSIAKPKLKDWDGFVEVFRKSLENDRSPGQ